MPNKALLSDKFSAERGVRLLNGVPYGRGMAAASQNRYYEPNSDLSKL